jgi:hypothetical protein
MEWCEETQGVDYVFGFAGNDALHALTREAADAIAVQRTLSGKDKLRGFKAFRYGAKSWTSGSRCGYTNLPNGSPCTQNVDCASTQWRWPTQQLTRGLVNEIV